MVVLLIVGLDFEGRKAAVKSARETREAGKDKKIRHVMLQCMCRSSGGGQTKTVMLTYNGVSCSSAFQPDRAVKPFLNVPVLRFAAFSLFINFILHSNIDVIDIEHTS